MTVFSIGLNVGASEPAQQLDRTLRAIAPTTGGLVADVRTGRGEWEGTAERFVQVSVTGLPSRIGTVLRRAGELAARLHQDAIAVHFPEVMPNRWVLVKATGDWDMGGSVKEFPVIVEC